ncbi:uncharacterized protein TM35_000033220 [Trypanosoma theileri]|uniref:Uncharacterized protein n=1 Tax=Trypanosoma theileri TaxID=67003 RepID=A0A1X0P7N2_9TRYP|nr:uncharacterized protein TM35_000033220 [Trypanosoma theileri]ORC92569.1 hypothetical protein TM35_000033220 [Trypanosoma theileri]
MNRKNAVGKNARSSTVSVGLRPEEGPLLPEMPPFFPDPVALDAEDRHLVVLRDALFQREYEQSTKALLYHVEMQLEKREKEEGSRSGSCTPASRLSSVDTPGRDVSRTALSPLPPEPATESTPIPPIPSERKDVVLSGRTPSVLKSKGSKKGGVTEDSVDPPQIVNIAGGSIASVILANDDNEIGQDVTSKQGKSVPGVVFDESEVEGDQHQQEHRFRTPLTTPEIPVYLTQPMPPSLITLAEEIGRTNATLDTCAAVMTILQAQEQHGGSIIPLLCPVQSAEATVEPRKATETASVITPSTFSSGSQRGKTSIAVPPIRYVSTFPLIDAFVLEAEQRVAVEMFCEDICENIVSLAAEIYVSRCFDALATSYTAYSVWDELHDNVVRSFIPRDPGKPRSLESELDSALAIRQVKNKKSNSENVVNARNFILPTTGSINGSPPYFGMLPIWTSSPSLLSAEAILSFHQKATVPPKVFSGKDEDNSSHINKSDSENEKPKSIVHRPLSSTFSRLLDASLQEGQKRRAVNGVIVTDFSPRGKSNEAWRATGFTIEEDMKNPGDPPDAIPLDDYARYVIPKSEDVLKKQQQEEEEKKNKEEELGSRKVQRRRVSRKSQRSLSGQNVSNRKEGEGEVQQSVNPHGSDYNSSQMIKGKKRRGKQLQQELSDAVTVSIGGGSTTRPISPEFMGDDNWTKALRHLPRGYLSMVGTSNQITSGRNQTTENLVLIEGDNAVTVASNVKKQRGTSADGDNLSDIKKSRSRNRSLSPTTQASTRSDDPKTTLQVNITHYGTVSFNTIRGSVTTSATTQNRGITSPFRQEKNNKQKQQQTQSQKESQKQESPKRMVKSRDGYTFLSRKEQRRQEERLRRQKEAAEQAAYENMFFTAPPPPVNTSAENAENTGSNQETKKTQTQPQSQQPLKIVPEPGVLIEQWPTASPDKNTKSGVVINTKTRYRRGKETETARQETQSGAIVSDGGDWILPDGKYRWSGFDPANREKAAAAAAAATTTTPVVAAAPVPRPAVSISTEGKFISQQKSSEEREEGKVEGSTTQNKESSPKNNASTRTFPKPVARPIRRAPPVIVTTHKEEEKPKQKSEKDKKVSDKELNEKAKTLTMKRNRAAKSSPLRVTLPRLPPQLQLSNGENEPLSGRKGVKTPSAVEENKIRLLASILQNTKGMME